MAWPRITSPIVGQRYAIHPKPPVLWLRGDSDQVIADESFFDLATFGKTQVILRVLASEEGCKPQPMIAQISFWCIDKYAPAGNIDQEVANRRLRSHTRCIEKADAFNQALHRLFFGARHVIVGGPVYCRESG